jgi:hypothetical protein
VARPRRLALSWPIGGDGRFEPVIEVLPLPENRMGRHCTRARTTGLGIGLLTYFGPLYAQVKRAESDSRMRYTTPAADRGVAFSVSRSEMDESEAIAKSLPIDQLPPYGR